MNNKKIRILETIRQGKVGGGETHVLDLVRHINKDEFEPVVLSFTDGPMVDQLRGLGIQTEVIYTERGFNVPLWGKVKKLIMENNIDIVHAHGTRANSNTFWAANSLNIPFIYTIHGWSFHQDQAFLINRLRKFSESFLTSRADLNITVSKSNQDDGINFFNMKNSTVIYNGIDRDKFNPANEYKDIRTEFGIPTDKTLIGFVVRMTLQKDPFTLIKAFRKVVDSSKDIILLMVGEGDLKAQCIQMCKDLKLEDNIIFSNFRQDIPDILNAINIYCLPSLWEGLPIGLLEAMAMKKVVIATPVDGTKEIIEDGVNGFIVPHQNPDKLAEAILKVHNNKDIRNNIAENALNTIINKFDVIKMTRQVEVLYRDILKK